ncbi:MAG: acyltransferase [Sphingomonadales bacterium]|nr:acyltransferase [Sphingomonadales bacterium]
MDRPSAPRHLDALTGIRGIAAWGVVLYHIRLSLLTLFPASVIAVLAKGYLAVDLFFMLSGFVIWYNYAGKIEAGGWSATRQFLWRRLARVWPLHVAILAVLVAFVALLAATGRDISNYPFGELPLHVLLVQNWGFTRNLSWNHPAWSISTELAAYLAFPALVAAARWSRVASAVLLAGVAALALALYAGFAAAGYGNLGADITHLGLWRCLAEFTMGCLMCQLWQRWRNISWASYAATACGAAVLALGVHRGLPETAFVPLTFFCLLFALSLARNMVARVIGGPTLTYLGEISYSTYLSHFVLFIFYKIAFVDATLQLGWTGLGGYLALVLAVSAGLYRWVEKPAQRWLNVRPPRWRRPAPGGIAD